jgi:hypothetical protein
MRFTACLLALGMTVLLSLAALGTARALKPAIQEQPANLSFEKVQPRQAAV